MRPDPRATMDPRLAPADPRAMYRPPMPQPAPAPIPEPPGLDNARARRAGCLLTCAQPELQQLVDGMTFDQIRALPVERNEIELLIAVKQRMLHQQGRV